ncbi:DNA repair protein RecO [Acidocella sp.]|uniref:DNA repair protein RecO n=1 Tax=Acidocella sp. TaxID=50710 RepID=UPI00262A525C|nr:DNA repair protein RecO [Acidocella sp.]
MEWDGPAILLDTQPYGEGDLLAGLLTPRGLWRGLARGGASRRQAAIWQRGNILAARWVARTETQLGAVSAELVRPVAALAMHDPEALLVLNAACALAAQAAPEREALPGSFEGLLRLLAGIDIAGLGLTALCRWELVLLKELGFGLDFSSSAGGNDRLAYVSPRTGRAVTLSEAGDWVARLLVLPDFLIGEAPARLADHVAALKLTGHFLARDVFGARHKPLPPARAGLYEHLARRLDEGGYAG